MFRRIEFRYGYGVIERCGLTLWTLCWCLAIAYVLSVGEINVGDSVGASTYSRSEDPSAYWTWVSVMVAMVCVGLALTFEVTLTSDRGANGQDD